MELAENIKTDFEIIHKNHCKVIKQFKKYYLSKIESLEESEYLKMKSWIKEYERMLINLQNHLINFEEYSHKVEHPDTDNLIKQVAAIVFCSQYFGLNSIHQR